MPEENNNDGEVSCKLSLLKEDGKFVGGDERSREILDALPVNVVINFDVNETDESDVQNSGLEIDGVKLEELSMEDYFLLSEKITTTILDKTKIPKHFLDDIWSGNSRNFSSLAFILRGHLAVLRQAEADKKKGKSTNAPVLGDKLLSRSEISYVVYQMLTTVLEGTEHNYMAELVAVLLDVDLMESRLLKNSNEKEKAKYILAQVPEISTRQLAAEIDVNHTTISRWLKDPNFIKSVEYLRELFELQKQGKSPLDRYKKS